jgi:hypothetical protein
MERELRNGDLVRIPASQVSPAYEGFKSSGLIGLVIDDIDAHEEVHIMYAGSLDTGWWPVGELELVSDGGAESYCSRIKCISPTCACRGRNAQ